MWSALGYGMSANTNQEGNMITTGPLAERYAASVEREHERNRLYTALIEAQLAGDTEATQRAQQAVDVFEGPGDY